MRRRREMWLQRLKAHWFGRILVRLRVRPDANLLFCDGCLFGSRSGYFASRGSRLQASHTMEA
jgi:hypothetical protein